MRKTLRVFAASVFSETNTFSSVRTTLESFHQCYFARHCDHQRNNNYRAAILKQFRLMCAEKGYPYYESICAAAQPGGVLTQESFETLSSMILEDLAHQNEVDLILLSMHGAMVADGYSDCEGALLSKIRFLVGQEVVIGIVLDPHAHLTVEMLEYTNMIVAYKEYPHTDYLASASELFVLSEELCLEGGDNVVKHVKECNMINLYATKREPMCSFNKKLRHFEVAIPEVYSISFIHGFPWGDVPEAGSKLLMLTQRGFRGADEILDKLYDELVKIREDTFFKIIKANKLELYRNADRSKLIISDISDNPGGGAAGRAITIPNMLFSAGYRDIVILTLWEPDLVKFCESVGKGGWVSLKSSGDRMHLDSLGESWQVEAMIQDYCMKFWNGVTTDFGNIVMLSRGPISIVLASKRAQVLNKNILSDLNIEANRFRYIVIKSSCHFTENFRIPGYKVIFYDWGGEMTTDFQSLSYRHIKRSLWPLNNL